MKDVLVGWAIMNEYIFNSSKEVQLRILLLLSLCTDESLSLDRIVYYDFMTCFGIDFEVSDYNLHGDNNFRYSELSSRREMISVALKKLVIKGLVDISSNNGFEYSISKTGSDLVRKLGSLYALEYKKICVEVLLEYTSFTDIELFDYISQKSTLYASRR